PIFCAEPAGARRYATASAAVNRTGSPRNSNSTTRKEDRMTGESDMANKAAYSEAVSSAPGPEFGNELIAKPPEIADLLVKAEQLLQAGKPKKALDLIARAKLNSPWATNALGVCHLRLGNAKVAVDLFRGLVLAGGILLRADVPVVFKTNYAAA